MTVETPLDSTPEASDGTSGHRDAGEDPAEQKAALRARVGTAPTHKVLPHPTVQERQRNGKAARATSPREGLAIWKAPADRADPIALLTGQDASRVQELVPVRHSRMSTSAFAFYRGAALLMAADLATCPRSGLEVQLCGDAHLFNFGMFASPDRSVVFDVNDFDETNPGPFDWDVKRLATSFVLAARDNQMTDQDGVAAAEAVAASYRNAMAILAKRPEIDIWYARIDATNVHEWMQPTLSGNAKRDAKIRAKAQAAVDQATSKARQNDAWSAIDKLTQVVDGTRQFLNEPPLLMRLPADDDVPGVVNALFHEYRATLQDDRQALLKRYEITDLGHKVVGVGSVGLLAFVILLRGRDEDDLMVLQVKEAQASVLEAVTHASVYTSHGHRVVSGQRLMQATSDSFLGWIEAAEGRSFYVRQLRDMKWSPDLSTLKGKKLTVYAELCGRTLARAHARSGDAIALAAYMGKGTSFDEAISTFALSYADQAQQDFAAITAEIGAGRMFAQEDAGGSQGLTAARQFAYPSDAKTAAT